MLSYTSIFSVQSTAHLAVYRLVCLSVGLSVTPGDCLPAWLFMSVCVYICTSIYLCLYFSFGLSINKSIHQFVFSQYVYLSLSIHPSSVLSTTALLSPTCPIVNKMASSFPCFHHRIVWNNSWNSSLWTKHIPQGPTFPSREMAAGKDQRISHPTTP